MAAQHEREGRRSARLIASSTLLCELIPDQLAALANPSMASLRSAGLPQHPNSTLSIFAIDIGAAATSSQVMVASH